MKVLKTLSVLTIASTLAVSAHAEAFFQAALWPPDLQLVAPSDDVKGLRLNIYGENRNVTGVDIGFLNVTTGNFVGWAGPVIGALYNRVDGTTTGIQWGVVNYTQGSVLGWQNGLLNVSRAKVTGLQSGLVNWNDLTTADVSGVQLGFLNTAKHVHGVQFGFVNYAETLKGVQLGLWNQVDSRDWDQFDPLPKVFPFINVGF